jgi:hypothetical protein
MSGEAGRRQLPDGKATILEQQFHLSYASRQIISKPGN